MKIWVNAPFSAENMKLIKSAACGCEIICPPQDVGDAEIVVGSPPPHADFSRLRLLQSTNAGVEKLLSEGVPESVVITNVTGAFGEAVSEYIVAGILSLSRGILHYRDNQHRRLWRRAGRELLLCGGSALILGCGDIGGCAARKLRAFGMRVTGVRRRPTPTEGFDEVFGTDMLCGLLPKADVVVCCLPHTAETEGMLDSEMIALMKRGAIFVNVGRGSLVDTAALTEALNEGKLFGAVLDVFDKEPLSESSPLWEMENVLVTPHISGPSFGSLPQVERLVAEICADNISRFLSGKPLRNVIDRSTGYAEGSSRR